MTFRRALTRRSFFAAAAAVVRATATPEPLTLYLPPGVYPVRSPLRIPGGVRIVGIGAV